MAVHDGLGRPGCTARINNPSRWSKGSHSGLEFGLVACRQGVEVVQRAPGRGDAASAARRGSGQHPLAHAGAVRRAAGAAPPYDRALRRRRRSRHADQHLARSGGNDRAPPPGPCRASTLTRSRRWPQANATMACGVLGRKAHTRSPRCTPMPRSLAASEYHLAAQLRPRGCCIGRARACARSGTRWPGARPRAPRRHGAAPGARSSPARPRGTSAPGITGLASTRSCASATRWRRSPRSRPRRLRIAHRPAPHRVMALDRRRVEVQAAGLVQKRVNFRMRNSGKVLMTMSPCRPGVDPGVAMRTGAATSTAYRLQQVVGDGCAHAPCTACARPGMFLPSRITRALGAVGQHALALEQAVEAGSAKRASFDSPEFGP